MKGFSTLFLLFCLPIVLGLIAVSLSSYLVVYKYTVMQRLCRDTVLKTQVELAKGLNTILALNPSAQLLRQQEKLLLIALVAAAGNAPLIAKLTHQLYLNRVQQQKLRLKMSSIKLKTESVASYVLLKETKLKTHNKPQLHFVYRPSTAIAPDFIPAPKFENLQTLRISWSATTQNLFSQILKTPNLNSSCSATLHRKERKWLPILSVDKF